MKATCILIVSVLMALMLITSDARGAKKCSKKCTKFIKNKIGPLEERIQAQTEELNELKSDYQAQNEELNELKSENQGLQSAFESLNKTVTQLQNQFTDECESSPCLNNGMCKDEINGFNCSCPPGFVGNRCETELNECESSPCLNNGTCEDKINGFNCSCPPGFVGKKCETGAGLASSVILGQNNKYLTALNTWLNPVVQSKSSAWKRCWRASVDGWAASTFHSGCDNKGPTVTIIKVGQYIFGGYASVSWVSSCLGYRYDSKAFLFSLVNKPGWAPVKLTQTGQYSSARAHSTYSCSSTGSTFGGGYDILVSNYASSNKDSYTDLGYTYAPPSGYSWGSTFAQTFLAGGRFFQPDEVETFYETT